MVPQAVTIFVAKMIKVVRKRNHLVLEHVIRNVKQNKKINRRLVSICALINAWPVSVSNQIR